MYSEIKLKNKSSLQRLMLLIKFFIGLFPNKVKVMMRKNLWLHKLYSKNLQRSGLFYGFPSPEKLQKNYLKNIQKQTQVIAQLISETNTQIKLNAVIVLSGKIQVDVKCVNEIQGMREVQTVFLAGNDKNVKAVFSILENKHDIQAIVGSGLGDQNDSLPLFLLKSGDYLHRDAINVFMQALQKSDSNKLILYCDKDSLNAQCSRNKGDFLPDWNPDLQLSCGYINTGVLVSGAKNLKEFWHFAQLHPAPTLVSLWLASIYLNNLDVDIEHIPLTLVHQSVEYDFDWLTAIQDLNDNSFKVRKGSNIEVAQLQWNQKRLPLVSLVIPTKNAKALVQTCIESIFRNTDYVNFEILLIDNESDDPEALRYFASLRSNPKISVLSYPYAFNYSAINNFAVKHAKGEVIGLINNDIEVISPAWLTMMVGHAIRSDIGCVGAKLLYPDDRIQHAGVVLGYGGGAGHAHKYFPRYHPGYQNRLIASHNFSAVTAACLLVKKADYLAVGGFNEKDLTVAFNDVDFCLRVLQLGRRNLYCAEAVLYHHESISRGLDDTHAKRARFAKELQYLQTNWQSYIAHDPAYNPNLTLRHENFSIKE
jgi:GT2 family glycosyltransferase